ncbi:odorant receptor 131-2-like [Bombina bombina]|uniref:odorant receptor 131-2-like n=1 Tax=Bombina bombina TaxID=8345 RepID=UPI00235AFA8E|nr:odorant receptor 131-2-like [Bombina bombina]
MTNNTTLGITEGSSTNLIALIVKLGSFLVLISCFLIFLHAITIILRVYFTTAHVREDSRYVLFIHMIINDTLYLSLGMWLYIAAMYIVLTPVPICYIIFTLSTSTFRITPYNLAAMSLERYVAICFPLRHPQICTTRKTSLVIAIIWLVALIPNVADFIALNLFVEKNYYSFNIVCTRVVITKTEVQNSIRLFSLIISFTIVGLIIIFTYVKVILVARKIGSDKSSAMKASKTIVLHAFQLLLCMFSFSSSLTETYLAKYLIYINLFNFLLFMCLPRFLSPLIYGFKDAVFKKHLRTFCSAKHYGC